MCVEVEDVLAGGLTGVVLDVDAIGLESRVEQSGDSMHRGGDLTVCRFGYLIEIARVRTWDNQCVAWRGGPDVQERHGVLVLEDAIRRLSASDDLAEDALVHNDHDRIQSAPRTTGFRDRHTAPLRS